MALAPFRADEVGRGNGCLAGPARLTKGQSDRPPPARHEI
jgi:hypothetical protein